MPANPGRKASRQISTSQPAARPCEADAASTSPFRLGRNRSLSGASSMTTAIPSPSAPPRALDQTGTASPEKMRPNMATVYGNAPDPKVRAQELVQEY